MSGRPKRGAALIREMDEKNYHTIEWALNVQQIRLLNKLLTTGLWGSTPRDVARRLLDEALRLHAQKETKDA